jgi:hypothetical protein
MDIRNLLSCIATPGDALNVMKMCAKSASKTLFSLQARNFSIACYREKETCKPYHHSLKTCLG